MATQAKNIKVKSKKKPIQVPVYGVIKKKNKKIDQINQLLNKLINQF